ncbi:MAG: hypothetical protein GF368_03440 [Candidatus Aenigmarchaeota archaeon]|nr:hypothetical protein [Candidatus Aenigmarchaeota archaeon]
MKLIMSSDYTYPHGTRARVVKEISPLIDDGRVWIPSHRTVPVGTEVTLKGEYSINGPALVCCGPLYKLRRVENLGEYCEIL